MNSAFISSKIFFALCLLQGSFAFAQAAAPFYLNESNGLVSNDTRNLLIAKDGSVYIGTGNGLTRFKDGSSFNMKDANGRKLEIITALGEAQSLDSNGKRVSQILVGKARDLGAWGLRGFGIETLKWSETGTHFWGNPSDVHYPNTWVSAISVEPSSEIEILALSYNASNIGGAHIVSDPSFTGSCDCLNGENLYSIVDWSNQKLIGGDDGLFVFDNRTNQTIPLNSSDWQGGGGFLDASSNKHVRALAKDAAGNIWVGLQADSFVSGGLVQFTPDANDLLKGTWSKPKSLGGTTNSNHVNALVVDGNNSLWIATDDGLKRRDADGTFHAFGLADGLSSMVIRDIAYDGNTQFLWIATNKGVTRFLIQ